MFITSDWSPNLKSTAGTHASYLGRVLSIFLAVITLTDLADTEGAESNTNELKKSIQVTSPESTEDTNSLSVGINGLYRVGHWTGIRHVNHHRIESIRTRDGDGMEARYEQSVQENDTRWAYVIPGTEAAPLIVETENGETISTRFPEKGSPSRGAAMIPLSMPWIVAIGDPLGLDRLGANELLDRDASIAVSKTSNAAGLPDSELGYDGVDLVLIGGSGTEVLRGMSTHQQHALVRWVQAGGRILLTVGKSSTMLFQECPWIKELMPLEEVRVEELDPSSIETFTSSQTPLEPFEGLRLPAEPGSTLLLGRTSRRENTPIAKRFNLGLGEVIAISADLEAPIFSNWPERTDLLTQILGPLVQPDNELTGSKKRSTAYNDLAGQLRTTLDRFEIKKGFSFSFLSVIILLFLALIGPLDFLLLNRLLGKPLLGWLSFPLTAIAVSVFLAYQSLPLAHDYALEESTYETPAEPIISRLDTIANEMSATNPSVEWNRFEVVDIDTTIRSGSVKSIHYFYCHEAQLTNPNISGQPSLLEKLGKSNNEGLTTPFGYPGQSFGGIQIGIEDSRLPTYSIRLTLDHNTGNHSSIVTDVPIASRSSKGLKSEIQFTPTALNAEPITRRPGSELLQGTLKNPVDIDILDGMLIYRNWIYLLPTRFPAGSQIESLDSLRQKNFRWQLSRQKALESSSETEPWDPADTKKLNRIGEIVLFHEAAGGTRYTTLKNGPLADLDLSHVLSDDRCILLGHLSQPATKLQLNDNFEAELPGIRETFMRVVLPVESLSR